MSLKTLVKDTGFNSLPFEDKKKAIVSVDPSAKSLSDDQIQALVVGLGGAYDTDQAKAAVSGFVNPVCQCANEGF